MTKNFLAASDNIGDGWDDRDDVVARWNKMIAPILKAATTDIMLENEEEPLVSVGSGIAMRASDWAWEQFSCNQIGGVIPAESDELCEILATQLREKLTRVQ